MFFFSEQSCLGEARESQSSRKLSHSNGSFWTARRKGEKMYLRCLYVIFAMVSYLPRDSGTNNGSVFSFFCQISESGLIEILEKVNQQTEKKTTVKVSSTYVTYFSIYCHLLISLGLCSVLVSSTDGGSWTRMMRKMTDFQTESLNEPTTRNGYSLLGL